LPLDDAQRADWLARIADAGLALIAQQWETVMHPKFELHRAALDTYLNNACAAKPLFVNSHTGRDIYSPAQNRELIALARRISQAHGVPIFHEIHRSRFSAHPMLLLPYLQEMPELELTADLSHWCCVCETLLEDQPENLEATFPHVRHIHARVGHAQGPQVSDFRAPEWATALEQHLRCPTARRQCPTHGSSMWPCWACCGSAWFSWFCLGLARRIGASRQTALCSGAGPRCAAGRRPC
jgi:hypothetical protein